MDKTCLKHFEKSFRGLHTKRKLPYEMSDGESLSGGEMDGVDFSDGDMAVSVLYVTHEMIFRNFSDTFSPCFLNNESRVYCILHIILSIHVH